MGEGRLTPGRGVDAALFAAKQTGSLPGGTGGEQPRFVTVNSETERPATAQPPGRMGRGRSFVVPESPPTARPRVVPQPLQKDFVHEEPADQAGSTPRADFPVIEDQRPEASSRRRQRRQPPPESGDAGVQDAEGSSGRQSASGQPGVQGAHEDTFTDMVRGTQRGLLAAAYQKTGNTADAEDEVQETYLKAWRALGEGGEIRSPKAFLSTVLSRVNADRAETAARLNRNAALAAQGTDLATPSQEGDITERDEMIGFLRRLPPRQRNVLALRYYGDMTQAQVAEELDTTVDAVNTATRKGLANLKNLMTKE